MDRAEFLAQVIAALQEQNDAPTASAAPSSSEAASPSPPSSSSSSSPLSSAAGSATGLFRERWRDAVLDDVTDADADAREAYARLQFDFPQITDAQLRALAAFYRRVAQQGDAGGDGDAQLLPVTNALVAGVAFLSEQAGDGAEARGLLAAALLLLLPARCLGFADQVRTRALLSRVMVPQAGSPAAPGAAIAAATAAADDDGGGGGVCAEKFAAEEDPDDLSQVYEGSAPTTGRFVAAPPPARAMGDAAGGDGGGGAFVDKLQFLASRTFSSAFVGIPVERWDEWALDRTLGAIVQRLLLSESSRQAQTQTQTRQHLYGHPHGEWTRYLYILRDRVLHFPNGSRGAIQALRGLVELLQPAAGLRAQQQQLSGKEGSALAVGEAGGEIQPPHHLVYRVLAELVLSKELQQRSSQPAQRELAAALHALVPRIVQELQRLGARRHAALPTGNRAPGSNDERPAAAADENDDLVLILTQLVHFLLFASPNKRVTADKLQESGVLRALLALVPVELSVAHATMTSKRFWFTPLVRLVAECAVWNVEFAEFVVRVPKFVALFPAMREQFPAELALLLVAFYNHELQSATPIQALVKGELDDGTSSSTTSRQLWDVFVSGSLFPQACTSYLDSMAKLQDAVYFLECIIEALGATSAQLVGDLRASLQGIYPSFSHAFVYPSFSTASAEPKQETAAAEKQIVDVDSDGPISDGDAETQEREERGAAESLQFIALRNKLRQCTKTVLLTSSSSSSSSGGFTASSASYSYSSSKLD